jgi:hypothetical protein
VDRTCGWRVRAVMAEVNGGLYLDDPDADVWIKFPTWRLRDKNHPIGAYHPCLAEPVNCQRFGNPSTIQRSDLEIRTVVEKLLPSPERQADRPILEEVRKSRSDL